MNGVFKFVTYENKELKQFVLNDPRRMLMAQLENLETLLLNGNVYMLLNA
jgi:uncharacterized membrane protein YkgB